MTETTNAVGTKQILQAKGDQLKQALEGKPAPNETVTTNSTPKITSDVAQTTVTVKPGATDEPQQPTAPKTVKVKSGATEEDVPEDKLVEYGKKYYGLEKHFTQQGQELAAIRKELQKKEQEIATREASIKDTMESVLAKRDSERVSYERQRQEELELKQLEEEDPVKAEILKTRREMERTISEIKEGFGREISDLKSFKEQTRALEQAQRDRDLLMQLEEAAKQANIPPGWIIGEMAADPTKIDPYEVAKFVSADIQAKIDKAVEERMAQLNQPNNNRAETRIPSANAGTPQLTPTGEPLPNILKDKQDFAQRLNKALEGYSKANMRM